MQAMNGCFTANAAPKRNAANELWNRSLIEILTIAATATRLMPHRGRYLLDSMMFFFIIFNCVRHL